MKRRAFIHAAPVVAAGTVAIPALVISSMPEDRFQHHLGEMLLALAEMPWPEGSRWFLAAAGRSGRGSLLELTRYDTVPDPEIPGLMIERSTEIIGV